MLSRYKEKLHQAVIKPFAKRAIKRQTRGDDIFVVTYPKSGTVWTGFMMANVQNLKYSYAGELNLKDYTSIVPDANFALVKPGWLGQFEGLHSPRAFTTHATGDYWGILPKIVYIIRDPRDVVVSYYHHHRRYFKGFNKSIAEFVFDFDNYSPSSWIYHVNGWMRYLGEDNFIFITYENLRSDTVGVLKKILHYANIEADDEMVRKAIELASFDNMKKIEKKYGGAIEPKGDKSGSFVRKGKKGGYVDELTPELIEFINEKVRSTVRKFDLPYEV